jgi:integrase/recombinase XerC
MNTNLAQVIDFNDIKTKYNDYEQRYIVEDFINSFQSQQTKRAYINDITDFFEENNIKQITNPIIKSVKYNLIQEYVSNMVENEYSKATIKRRIASLQSLYNYCIDEKILKENPFTDKRIGRLLRNKLPKNEIYLGNVLSIDQIKELYSNIDYDRDLKLIQLILRTGIRKEEATTVKWNSFIYKEIEQKWFLYVRGKGRKDRYIEIGNCYIKELQQNELFGSNKFMFPNPNGQQMTGSNIRRILKKYSDISVHDLRRTFATNLINKGISIVELQMILGHSSINTTMAYIRNANRFNQSLGDLVEW